MVQLTRTVLDITMRRWRACWRVIFLLWNSTDWRTVFRRRDRDRKIGGYLGEPFAHDVYVSYSPGAAGERDPDLNAWSRKFADDIRVELLSVGEFEHLSVFLDESDRSHENVDPLNGYGAE